MKTQLTQPTAHTPGPWTADRHFIHAPTMRFVAVVSDGPQQGPNARLIASAPDLLAALEKIVAEAPGMIEDIENQNIYGSDAVAVIQNNARAAIARAKGVQS